MSRVSLAIPPRILAGLRRHAATAIPAECCGALVGVAAGGVIEIRALVPVVNEATGNSRYAIGAPVVRDLERQAGCAGLQLLGFYHSHPNSPATPSAADLELAWPGYLYIIVDATSCAVRVWRLLDDRSGFDELPQSPIEIAGAA